MVGVAPPVKVVLASLSAGFILFVGDPPPEVRLESYWEV